MLRRAGGVGARRGRDGGGVRLDVVVGGVIIAPPHVAAPDVRETGCNVLRELLEANKVATKEFGQSEDPVHTRVFDKLAFRLMQDVREPFLTSVARESPTL